MPGKTDTSFMSRPRYGGIATFMRAPLIEDPAEADVVFVGIPFDATVTVRPGARLGPRELRQQSGFCRMIHPVTRKNVYEQCRVGDLGDVVFRDPLNVEASANDIADLFARIKASGARPIAAGGDHYVSLPILRGLVGGSQPIGLIQIDAHTDTWDRFGSSRHNHGTMFRRAIEEGLVDPRRSLQIGLRGAQNSDEGWRFSEEAGMRLIFMDEVESLGIPAVLAEIARVAGSGPAYLTFDIDAIDPACAPGTGALEFGGLTSREALALVRGLTGIPLIGADLVEVSPAHDPSGVTGLLGATLMFEMLALMASQIG